MGHMTGRGPSFGDLMVDLLLALVGFLAFSALTAGVVWGWRHQPVGTVALIATLGIVLGFGVRRSSSKILRQTRARK